MTTWLVLALGLELRLPHACWADGLSSPERVRAAIEALEEAGDRVARALGSVWTRRPEWADMLLSILQGEEPRLGAGWYRPSEDLRGWDWLRERFDQDGDGRVSRSEMGQAGRHMVALDENGDEVITSLDFETGDRLGGKGKDPSVAIFRLLDEDRNARVSWDELSWFFQKADRRKQGFISRKDLARVLEGVFPAAGGEGEREDVEHHPSRWGLLERFFDRELGSFREGPALGAPAPDFELALVRGGRTVRLSDARGKKPVILVFGSFT